MAQNSTEVTSQGLGGSFGSFFRELFEDVTGVAKAVAPIAPFVLPFVAPYLASTGIGSLLGGKVGTFLTSKLGQAALGAGIQGLAGKKPADIAKNLALQVATSGIRGALKGGEGTIGQKFMSGVTGREIPQVTSISNNIPQGGSYTLSDVLAEPTSTTPDFNNASMDLTTNLDVPKGTENSSNFFSKLGETFNPEKRAINPNFTKTKAFAELTGNPLSDQAIEAMGISKAAPFTYQYGPALQATLATVPGIEAAYNYLNAPEEEEVEEETGISENLYASDPSQYQIGSITGYNPEGYYLPPIATAAEGGEVTGFAEGGGRKIEHSDGDVKDHPKRIGEIVGRGTGTSDDIPAMLSDGEFVMTAQAVRNAGGGSRKVGAKNMYKMMKSLENGGSLSQQSIGMA